MMVYYVLLLIMTLLGSVASLFLKSASGSANIIGMLKNVNLYIGGFLYLSSAILNIVVLRYLDYSVVLPLTSITYIWTMFFSYMVLKENITKKKLGGVVMIIVGAVVISL